MDVRTKWTRGTASRWGTRSSAAHLGDQRRAIEFDWRLEKYAARCLQLWGAQPGSADWGRPVEPREKIRRELAAERHRKAIAPLFRQHPASKAERAAWRYRLVQNLREAGRECLGFPEAGLNLFFTREAIDASCQFTEMAKAFDPRLSDGSLLQAIRNLWVVHGLQLFLQKEISLTRASFAYSMLYPCTDNCLDDDRIAPREKARFSEWLESRLRGFQSTLPDARTRSVDRLIAAIESCYPRAEYPELYLSLLAIHHAQLKSLLQQHPGALTAENAVLEITIEKGGASVLVDGYLAEPELRDDEGEFFFRYGVSLQLLDDLQDFKSDLRNQHLTLFGWHATAGSKLDEVTSRLWSFVNEVLWSSKRFAAPCFSPLKTLIQENCRIVILHAVASNQERYSRKFVDALEASSPFTFSYLASREQSLADEYKRVVAALPRHVLPARDLQRAALHDGSRFLECEAGELAEVAAD